MSKLKRWWLYGRPDPVDVVLRLLAVVVVGAVGCALLPTPTTPGTYILVRQTPDTGPQVIDQMYGTPAQVDAMVQSIIADDKTGPGITRTLWRKVDTKQ